MSENESFEAKIARETAETRKAVAARRLADAVLRSLQKQPVKPDADPTEVRVVATDATVAVLAPYVEAVAALEAIIFASDGCQGHRDCNHSMEPWQRARAVLQGFWDEYERDVLGRDAD